MSEIEVPKEWKESSIGSIASLITKGSTPTTYGYSYTEKGIPFLRAENILENRLELNQIRHISKESHEFLKRSKIKPGDVLITIAGTIGRSTYVPKNSPEMNSNQAVALIRLKNSCYPEFLSYFLNSQLAKKQITDSKVTTSIPNLSLAMIEKMTLFLPPLETQKKIIQKLDHILGQLEEKKKIISELQTSKLKHIKILSDKTIGNIISKLMHLDLSPDSWDIQKIENICQDIQPGFAEGKKNVKDGVIHLRMNNIGTNFDLNFGLIRTIDANKDQLKKYQLKQGDVIFNNTNSSKLVGKSAIFNDSKVCLYSNHLTRLRVKKELVLPEWLLFYFRARWLNGDFERMCNKWINQAAVNNNKIKNLEIPIPNLEIQKKIVGSLSNVSKNIEAIRTISESIFKQEKINLNHFQNLSSKILDVAFSGKLVN